MAEIEISKQVQDSLEEFIVRLHRYARRPDTPVPQAIAARNRAQELRDQLEEVFAARFEANSAEYKAALKEVQEAVKAANDAIERLHQMIEVLRKVQTVFEAFDKLLKAAARFVL